MRALTKEEVKIISGGGVDREAVVVAGISRVDYSGILAEYQMGDCMVQLQVAILQVKVTMQ